MHVVSLIQRKGGSSKTTTAVQLAACLAVMFPNLSIALADADPQQSASTWIKRSNGGMGVSVFRVAQDGEGVNLRSEIDDIDADICIIDTPPALSSISLRAALKSDLMLIPTSASIVDLSATKEAVATCLEAIEHKPSRKFLLVPSRIQNNTASGQQLRSLISGWGPVSESQLSLRVAFAESASVGLGVTTYCPDSPAAQEIGLLAEEVARLLDIK